MCVCVCVCAGVVVFDVFPVYELCVLHIAVLDVLLLDEVCVCVLHIAVLDVLPVHEHVFSAQTPDGSVADLDVRFKQLPTLRTHVRHTHLVDAVTRDVRHRGSVGRVHAHTHTHTHT